MPLWNDACPNVVENAPLADKTTWRIGGVARYYAEPSGANELTALLAEAERRSLRVYSLGGGSNVLVTDGTLDGLVVRAKPGEISLCEDDAKIMCDASVPLARLLKFAAENGLSGLEELSGIPGSVGGAVRMNAGGVDFGIGNLVEKVEALGGGGRCVELAGDLLKFSYRSSNLEGLFVSGVTLSLKRDNPQAVQERMLAALQKKRETQPLGEKSAGCVFKNSPGYSAGKLIDDAGMKDCRIGGAKVSERHANFIVNEGNATCDDVRHLIDYVRSSVRRVSGIELKLEVKLWV